MPVAPSSESESCTDALRWYVTNLEMGEADVAVPLGYSCVTDLCIQRLFDEEYTRLTEGTDYTADYDAGLVTFLAEMEGSAIAYFNALTCETEPECKTAPCCPPDIYEYQSVNGTDSGTETNEDCVEVAVTVEPISGAFVFFPTYVVLNVDHDDAVIRYTTDGSEPDEFSTIYTGPFVVDQAGTIVKASATVSTCSAGPITTVLYQNPPFEIGMVYNCDTPDNGGTWDVWAANGTVDNHWQIEFTLLASTTIKRLEMYQLDANGDWTTGIVWSTDSPINGSFDAMPLLLFIAAVQQHTDYQSSLGAFGIATHTWDLYGDRQFPVSGFFRLEMVLDDDSRLISIIDATCTADPPMPCPSPAAPTTLALCDGAVDVTFVGTAGQNYKVYVSEVGSPGGWVLLLNDSMPASPHTYEATGLTPGALYYFRVELEYVDCGYQSSIPVSAVPLPDPVVTIDSDKLVVDPNESFTISWTSTNIGGAVCGGCLDGQVGINQGLGCKAGNASSSQATSQATTGLYTYTITGCNTCGTVVDSVQVEVRDTAVCTVKPTILNVANPTTFLCGFEGACLFGGSTGTTVWNGQIPFVSGCSWGTAFLRMACISSFTVPDLSIGVTFSVNKWVMQLTDGANDWWTGEKLFGNSPLGTYTQTSGCATGPATITVT